MGTGYYVSLKSRLSSLFSSLPELEDNERMALQSALQIISSLISLQIVEIQAYEARHKSM